MHMKVNGEIIVPASGTSVNESRSQMYLEHTGLKRRETRAFESQSDTSDYSEHRDSDDNGRTWGEWVREKLKTKERVGDDDIAEGGYSFAQNVWNPVHQHYVSLKNQLIYLGGYDVATPAMWRGERTRIIHTFLQIENESHTESNSQMVNYEEGDSFDEATYHETNYLERNLTGSSAIWVMKNGDILFNLDIPMDICCRLAGLDVNEVCPSIPLMAPGLLVCRGKWNADTKSYDLTFSKPIVLDDRQSSRGISEPVFAELASGKILVVFRASNCVVPQWNTRISPYAPNYKWYCLSDDGGKTFSPPMPWHFDTREVIYSSATYSLFLRSSVNGKLYWFGNITDPTKTDGNYPRYPLQIVEVDEEWGCAKKDTLTVIDTCREGESERVQLSNFGLLEDRETGNIELYLTKYGQYPNRHTRDCEVWKYTITLPR